MRQTDRDRGQNTLEYVGLTVLVAGCLAAVIASNALAVLPPRFSAAVCAVLNPDQPGKCDSPTLLPDDGDGTTVPDDVPPACIVEQWQSKKTTSSTVLFERNKSGRRYMKIEKSDGTILILDTKIEGHGAGAGLSFKVRGIGVTVDAAGMRTKEVGTYYVLDTKKSRERFHDIMGARARYLYRNHGLSRSDKLLLQGDIQGAARAKHYMQQIMHTLPHRSYYKVGPEGSINVGASAFGAYAGMELGAGKKKIVMVDSETGNTTVSWQIKGEAAGKLGVLMGPNARGSGSQGVTVSVTVDKNGKPIEAKFRSITALQGTGDLGSGQVDSLLGLQDFKKGGGKVPGSKLGKVTKALSKHAVPMAEIQMTDEAASMVRIDATLDLRSPGAREAVLGFLEDPGVGTSARLATQVSNNSEVVVQGMQGHVKTEAGQLGLVVLGGFAVGSSDTFSEFKLTSAISYDPENGWQVREDCVS